MARVASLIQILMKQVLLTLNSSIVAWLMKSLSIATRWLECSIAETVSQSKSWSNWKIWHPTVSGSSNWWSRLVSCSRQSTLTLFNSLASYPKHRPSFTRCWHSTKSSNARLRSLEETREVVRSMGAAMTTPVIADLMTIMAATMRRTKPKTTMICLTRITRLSWCKVAP